MNIYQTITTTTKRHNATLVLVTKTKSAELISEYYNIGHRDFGENKVQELVSKYEALPKDIRWHFIGHLQKNKVKYIAPFISMIHSVDSFELLKEIDQRALKNDRVIDILLEIKIASEMTKYGLSKDNCIALLENPELKSLKNTRICGLMGMATYTENSNIIIREFHDLKMFFDSLKNQYFNTSSHFSELSMGMSGDYEYALAEGATIVRIGSLILGER